MVFSFTGGINRVSELVKSIGSNDTEIDLCTPHGMGTDLHSDTVSTKKVSIIIYGFSRARIS